MTSGDIRLTGLRFYPYWGEKIYLDHVKVKRNSTGVCEYVHSKFNSTRERVLCINCPKVGASNGVVLPVKHLLYSTATSKQLWLSRGWCNVNLCEKIIKLICFTSFLKLRGGLKDRVYKKLPIGVIYQHGRKLLIYFKYNKG